MKHESCQREVTPLILSTVLIVRNLSCHGNEKNGASKNIKVSLTHSETVTYPPITCGQTPSVMYYLITLSTVSFVKNFSHTPYALRFVFPPVTKDGHSIRHRVSILCLRRSYITSLRLRRNAGTSRSSCSKFPTIGARIASSEITSPAIRSEGCAIGMGATSST